MRLDIRTIDGTLRGSVVYVDGVLVEESDGDFVLNLSMGGPGTPTRVHVNGERDPGGTYIYLDGVLHTVDHGCRPDGSDVQPWLYLPADSYGSSWASPPDA